jgi:hypothetical protein
MAVGIVRILEVSTSQFISFARNSKLLDKIPFCRLTQYCRSNMTVDIARILEVSTSQVKIFDKVDGPDADKSEWIKLEFLMDPEIAASKYFR